MNKKEKSSGLKKNSEKKFSLRSAVGGIAVALLSLLFVGAILIYILDFRSNSIAVSFSHFVPYPAAIVEYRSFVSVFDITRDTASARRFYESQNFEDINLRVDFSTPDGKRRLKLIERAVIDKNIEERAIEILAKREGVFVSDEMVRQDFARKLNEFGTRDALTETIGRLYGWDLETFQERIVRNSLLLKKLTQNFREKRDSKQASSKAQSALNELNGGADFNSVAKAYSEDGAAKEDGEIGWFEKGMLLPEVEEAAFSLKVGERSGVIESDVGFHIIRVEETGTGENGAQRVRLQQIFLSTPIFGVWLEDEMKKMSIFLPIKGYAWDKESARVVFTDKNMIEFEKNNTKL